jgi:hypothetical protein
MAINLLHIHNIARVRPDGGSDVFVTLSGINIRATQGTLGVEIPRANGTTEVIRPAIKCLAG